MNFPGIDTIIVAALALLALALLLVAALVPEVSKEALTGVGSIVTGLLGLARAAPPKEPHL